jgi:hypothetical protein
VKSLPLASTAYLLLAGWTSTPTIQTQLIDRPVAVRCVVTVPQVECKTAYALDRVSLADDPLTVNRALRAEIEERRACEVMLLAAVKGCNKHGVQSHD